MLNSKITVKNGRHTLYVNGTPTAAMAYTTYFEERSHYEDFIKEGYRIFFVNASFTSAPINSAKTGFTPFSVGVFEDPRHPDYSEFEDAVYKILRVCPDAVIFPRVYISMPGWWTASHPDEVIPTRKGGNREVLFSDVFRKDGEELLIRLIRHIKQADYAPRIGGWQICGGQTQEWFHPDMSGCLGPAAEKYYRRWVKETYGEENARLPKPEEFQYAGAVCQNNENARRYSIFCNEGVARSIDHFAGVIKRETDASQVVGSFYGYTFECNRTVLFGSHGLRLLLDSPNLDFFSSPNAYTKNRALGIDWADMIPVDSLRLHNKLAFIECDIRTYLTTGIQQARPGRYPDDIYQTKTGVSVWSGPPTPELSREALRKCFAHQITKSSAIWWFDMWGGWYANPLLMDELKRMKEIYDRDAERQPASSLRPQAAFFGDERGYANLFSNSPQLCGHFDTGGIISTRTAMGSTGVPYDTFLAEDAERILRNYQAAVFPFPVPSEAGKRAIALCEELHIPYLSATPEHFTLTVEDLRAFYKEAGLHFYTEGEDVIWVGNGYLALHAAAEGQKEIRLPRAVRITPVIPAGPTTESDCIVFDAKQFETRLFRVEE